MPTQNECAYVTGALSEERLFIYSRWKGSNEGEIFKMAGLLFSEKSGSSSYTIYLRARMRGGFSRWPTCFQLGRNFRASSFDHSL